MKRSQLKRSAAPPRRTPVKKRRAKLRKTSVHRDRGYLNWLRERKCVACIRANELNGVSPRGARWYTSDGCDPAHGPSAGMRVKGPDSGAISLCRFHHSEQHAIGWPAFEAKYGFSREKEAAAHHAVYLLTKE